MPPSRQQRTFVMVKPDGVKRKLVGEILGRFERRGLKIVAAKFMVISKELLKKHYAEHLEKPFFKDLEGYITSGPVMAMVLEGDNAVEMVRTMMGATDPQKSAPGSIRGDYAQFMGRNIIHGSDSLASAEREIGLFFRPEELVNYETPEWAVMF
jgi:nucleoside-diphosphate kinase